MLFCKGKIPRLKLCKTCRVPFVPDADVGTDNLTAEGGGAWSCVQGLTAVKRHGQVARTAPSAASPVSVLMGGNFVDTIKRVQDLMQARDMNLCVLAKKCGISYSTIQTTARRGGQLSVETIERICLGLGITLKDFFDSSYL